MFTIKSNYVTFTAIALYTVHIFSKILNNNNYLPAGVYIYSKYKQPNFYISSAHKCLAVSVISVA